MAKIGKILGSISPVYGSISGQGLFGKVQNALGPAAGILSQVTRAKREADAEERDKADFYRRHGFKSDGSFKKGGKVKKKAKGGSVKSSASKRGDGIATKGKTKGKFV